MNRWLWLCALAGVFVAPRQALRAEDEKPWEGGLFSAQPAAIIAAADNMPSPKDADVEVFLFERSYLFDEQGRRHFIFREVFRCLTKDGVDNWSYAEDEWSPWCEEKPALRAGHHPRRQGAFARPENNRRSAHLAGRKSLKRSADRSRTLACPGRGRGCGTGNRVPRNQALLCPRERGSFPLGQILSHTKKSIDHRGSS